jgi:hypothetical protein
VNARVAGRADKAGGPGGLGGRAGLARPGSGAAAAVTDLFFRDHHLEPVRLAIPFTDQGCSVLRLGPGGVHALVECTSTRTIFGRVDNGRFTPPPGIPYLGGIDFVDAAW